jgi:hypothetical protein
VADADPEHECRDVKAPERGPVLAGHADAEYELDAPRDEHHAGERHEQPDDDVVPHAGFE